MRSANGVRSFQPSEANLREARAAALEARAAALTEERELEIERLKYELDSIIRSLTRLIGEQAIRDIIRERPLPF